MSQIKHLTFRRSDKPCDFTGEYFWRFNLIIEPTQDSLLETWLKKESDEEKLNQFIYELDAFPGVYQYQEYLEDNPLVRGGFEYLKEIQEEEVHMSPAMLFCKLARVLQSLFLHWD
jgi:hypothetical protein